MPDKEQDRCVPAHVADLPDWARDRKQPRDPKTGFLWLRNCELYRAGHTVHSIQATRGIREAHRNGLLVAVDDNVITVDFTDEVKQYRNHEVERLVEIVGIGGNVRVREPFELLQGGGNFCFSISNIDQPWIPCDGVPLASTSPQALAERLATHGGFLVPGNLLGETPSSSEVTPL
jgi:hypothetical protein